MRSSSSQLLLFFASKYLGTRRPRPDQLMCSSLALLLCFHQDDRPQARATKPDPRPDQLMRSSLALILFAKRIFRHTKPRNIFGGPRPRSSINSNSTVAVAVKPVLTLQPTGHSFSYPAGFRRPCTLPQHYRLNLLP